MAMWLAVAVPLLAGLYYYFCIRERPQLIYQDNETNRALLDSCPSLGQAWLPTPWASNAHLQIILLLLRERFARPLVYEREDRLVMADGGTTAVEWLGLELPPETPTLVLLHSVGGCGQTLAPLSRYFTNRPGWRVAACIRRGHGDLPLTAPRYNTMGSTADLREQLAHIQASFPQSPLFAIGVSAGSGLLVRYLGEERGASPLRGAVAYSPAYDIDVAFARSRAPYNAHVTRSLLQDYILPNREQFEGLATLEDCLASRDLDELHHQIYQIAGFDSYRAFDAASNPMHVIDDIKVPLLIINALDDPVCVGRNVIENQEHMLRLPAGILVKTRRGSHCTFFEGWRGRSWAHRIMVDYLGAASRRA